MMGLSIKLRDVIAFLIGLVFALMMAFLSYRYMVMPAKNKEVKRLELIISDQNKTIEKLGSIEKIKIENEITNRNRIKNK